MELSGVLFGCDGLVWERWEMVGQTENLVGWLQSWLDGFKVGWHGFGFWLLGSYHQNNMIPFSLILLSPYMLVTVVPAS
jgi:hypothetical protein